MIILRGFITVTPFTLQIIISSTVNIKKMKILISAALMFAVCLCVCCNLVEDGSAVCDHCGWRVGCVLASKCVGVFKFVLVMCRGGN